jgi:hypothetical protein
MQKDPFLLLFLASTTFYMWERIIPPSSTFDVEPKTPRIGVINQTIIEVKTWLHEGFGCISGCKTVGGSIQSSTAVSASFFTAP